MPKFKNYPSAPTRKKAKEWIDAKEPLKFEVAQEDVLGSTVADPTRCAGACALKRQTGAEGVWVKRSRTLISYGDGRVVRYRNAVKLQTTVEQFDTTAGLFPVGQYELKPMPPAWTAEGSDKKNARRDAGLTKPRGPVTSRKRPVYAYR